MAKIPEGTELGKAIDENTIEINLKFELDPQPFDSGKLPGVIYYSDEPRQILEALPGWLRRFIVSYGRFVLNRRSRKDS